MRAPRFAAGAFFVFRATCSGLCNQKADCRFTHAFPNPEFRLAAPKRTCFGSNLADRKELVMNRTIFGMLVCAIVVAFFGLMAYHAPAAGAGDDEKEPKVVEDSKKAVAKFMRAKLHNSQSVLEGLTTEDFEKIKTGAQRMIVMAKAAEWNSFGGEVYARDTAAFVDSAQELIKNADDKNLDGATLSYVQLTMNCMACHKHLKGVQVASDVNQELRIAITASK